MGSSHQQAGPGDERPRVVLDTNVFVAAGFNSDSDSGWTIEAVRRGEIEMTWSDSTRAETEHILRKIPPLDWHHFSELFRPASKCGEPADLETFDVVQDRDDRKFAALARATSSVLISMDEHLLSVRDRLPIEIMKPGEYRALVSL